MTKLSMEDITKINEKKKATLQIREASEGKQAMERDYVNFNSVRTHLIVVAVKGVLALSLPVLDLC